MREKNTYPIGEIRKNNHGQEYIIIDKVKKGRMIKFIETGSEKKVGFKELINGKIRDPKAIIKKSPNENAKTFKEGEIHSNKYGQEFEIVEVLPNNKRKIKFLISGYETIAVTKRIKDKNIKDKLSSSVVGGGIVGTEIEHPQNHPLYDRWWNMLDRCYNPNNNTYYLYGAKGVTVCDEWKYFPNYVRDISSKENYDRILSDSNNWDIDKDILVDGNKVYSNETTLIVEKKVNIRHRNQKNRYAIAIPTHQFTVDGEYVKSHKSKADAYRDVKGITDFTTKISIWSIRMCEQGQKYKTTHGFKWVSDEDFKKYGIEEISNQIKRGER